jgi:hypothetical protein
MPPTKKPATATRPVLDAADHRRRLLNLRDRLTDELEEAPPAYVAAIARQLQAVLAELATLPAEDRGPSLADEMRARREARRAPQ